MCKRVHATCHGCFPCNENANQLFDCKQRANICTCNTSLFFRVSFPRWLLCIHSISSWLRKWGKFLSLMEPAVENSQSSQTLALHRW